MSAIIGRIHEAFYAEGRSEVDILFGQDLMAPYAGEFRIAGEMLHHVHGEECFAYPSEHVATSCMS